MKPTRPFLLLVLFLLGSGKAPGADKPGTPGAKPANESLRKELLRLMEEDQAARKKFIEWLGQQSKGDLKKDLADDHPVARSIRQITDNIRGLDLSVPAPSAPADCTCSRRAP